MKRLACLCLGALLACGCRPAREGSPRLYPTWASRGERVPRTKAVPAENLPPPGAEPWAGTVSHHLLAGAEIERWFAELAARRKVSCFFIICPSHYGLSTEPYSLTDGSWQAGSGRIVESDRRVVGALASALDVRLEREIFDPEHGISTLIPYIAEYFPDARVAAIAVRGEPPLDQPRAEKLAEALRPYFAVGGRAGTADLQAPASLLSGRGAANFRPPADGCGGNFLIVSTDFSHHGDLEQTDFKDRRSRRFFAAPSSGDWILAGCDNRPGIYVLSHLADSSVRDAVLFHCNSYELCGAGKEDITSYYFSFFW